MQFPKPVKRGPATMWRLSDLIAYESHMDGRSVPEIQPEDERYLNVRQVANRYGKSKPTIWRWCSVGV